MFKQSYTKKPFSRWHRGFTLIELLVVISIVATLVSVFTVSTVQANENAKIAKATSEAREITNAIRLFAMKMMMVTMILFHKSVSKKDSVKFLQIQQQSSQILSQTIAIFVILIVLLKVSLEVELLTLGEILIAFV
ncbi:MAG: prepilin-type N-terminal cleavage/methylation domain-containing protein [bacterium]|nr:prepilin-type N-terminal cleavage/methylation domain-containing protein [bacterium]